MPFPLERAFTTSRLDSTLLLKDSLPCDLGKGTGEVQHRLAAMGKTGETWLIYNGASGSHDENALRELVERLGGAGYPPSRVLDCKEGTPSAADARTAGLETIVIHGGDGTLSRTITRLEGFGGAVLPLPGGTFNLLAHEMFGEATASDIVDLLAAGGLVHSKRNCIRGPDVTALAELLVGPGAKWADVREELREANLGEVIVKGWDAAATSAVGPMVAVTNPSLGKEEGYAGIRLCPRDGGMSVEGFGAEGLGDYLQQGIAILKRDFREGPHDDLGELSSVECRSLEHQPIPLMVDGERREGGATLAFSLDTLDVHLLGPADDR